MNPFEKLEIRDRRVLYLALPVIAALVIFIAVVEPLHAGRQSAAFRLDAALGNIAWLQHRAREQRLTGNQCRGRSDADSPASLAARLGVLLEQDKDRLLVAGNGNDVLALVRHLPCVDYRVEEFGLSAAGGDGSVDGWIALAAM